MCRSTDQGEKMSKSEAKKGWKEIKEAKMGGKWKIQVKYFDKKIKKFRLGGGKESNCVKYILS